MISSNSFFNWIMGTSFALLALAGCTKYDQDGALVQFRSPEKRILGTWQSSSVTEVGTDADTNVTEFLTSNNLRLEAIFNKDGSVTFENLGEELFYEGDWAFNEDNSVLHLDLESLKPTGPFFLDADSVDREIVLNDALTYLQENDTLFFETGTFVDVTEDVLTCANALSQTGFVWTLVQGNGENGSLTIDGVQYFSGDVITAWVEAVIEDSMSDWQDEEWVVDEFDYDGIVSAIMLDYNAEVSYVNQKSPAISGLDDPNHLLSVPELPACALSMRLLLCERPQNVFHGHGATPPFFVVCPNHHHRGASNPLGHHHRSVLASHAIASHALPIPSAFAPVDRHHRPFGPNLFFHLRLLA